MSASTPGAPAGLTPPVPPALAFPLSLDAVRQAIAADLAADPGVPDGHRGALGFVVNQNLLQVATAVKVIDNGTVRWDVGAVVTHQWSGGTGFGVLGKLTF